MRASGADGAALLSSRPRVRALVGGFLFGLISALGYAPVGLYGAVLFACVPVFLVALRPCMSPGRAGFWAAVGVVPWWGLAHVWTINVSKLGFYPLVLLLSAYTWVFVWVVGRVSRRWGVGAAAVFLPVAWVGIEFLRGSVAFHGYAFYLTAHPLIEAGGTARGGFASPASWFGVYFVSFLVAVLNAVIAGASALRRRTYLGGAATVGVMAAFAVSIAWGSAAGGASVRVGVVQSNIPQDNRSAWTFRQRVADYLAMQELTWVAASHDPDVIAWPEGMFPGRAIERDALAAERAADLIWPMAPGAAGDAPGLTGVPDYIPAHELADALLALQGEVGTPMVVGSAGFDGFRVEEEGGGLRYRHDAIYNSVFVVSGGEPPTARYDKLHLAPFGEVMPYISAWPWLERQLLAVGASGMSFVLEPGDDATVLEVPRAGAEPVWVATPICFEATVPGVCRRLVFGGGERRAGVMLTLTNDGWFGDWTPGREHYALASRWRCVELGTPMVRVANTGISVAYDARGRVITDELRPESVAVEGRVPRDNVAGVLIADVPVGTGTTLYARVGDVFGWGVLVLTMVGAGGTFMPGGARDASGEPDPADDERGETPRKPQRAKE